MFTKKTTNVISLRKRKLEKKYRTLIKNKKYIFLFVGTPILLSAMLTIDKYFVVKSLESKGMEYNPYVYINTDYIANETQDNQYVDIKEYYRHKEKVEDFFEEKKQAICKY